MADTDLDSHKQIVPDFESKPAGGHPDAGIPSPSILALNIPRPMVCCVSFLSWTAR